MGQSIFPFFFKGNLSFKILISSEVGDGPRNPTSMNISKNHGSEVIF